MQYIKMKGNETFKVSVRTLEEVARETLAANHLRVEDLDLYVPHQANVRILKAVAERLGLPPEKMMLNLDRYGNTSAASIPIALDEAVQQRRIKEGSLVMLGAFGAGLTWASALIRW
jgi:3-oxoacyl-[acyl-carrier-protein] synthase-3